MTNFRIIGGQLPGTLKVVKCVVPLVQTSPANCSIQMRSWDFFTCENTVPSRFSFGPMLKRLLKRSQFLPDSMIVRLALRGLIPGRERGLVIVLFTGNIAFEFVGSN